MACLLSVQKICIPVCYRYAVSLEMLSRRCSSDTDESKRQESTTKNWSDLRKRQRDRFGSGWKPQKRLSRYQMDYLRTLKQEQPEEWTVSKLSASFGISTSAVLRILRSKWDPPPNVRERQDERAINIREERRQSAYERMAMDNGRNDKRTHNNSSRPHNNDLIIDFDT